MSVLAFFPKKIDYVVRICDLENSLWHLYFLSQALHCKNMQKARELWDTIMTKGNAKYANMWLEYYNLERCVDLCPVCVTVSQNSYMLSLIFDFVHLQVLWRPCSLSESPPQSSPVHIRLPGARVWSPAYLREGGRWAQCKTPACMRLKLFPRFTLSLSLLCPHRQALWRTGIWQCRRPRPGWTGLTSNVQRCVHHM